MDLRTDVFTFNKETPLRATRARRQNLNKTEPKRPNRNRWWRGRGLRSKPEDRRGPFTMAGQFTPLANDEYLAAWTILAKDGRLLYAAIDNPAGVPVDRAFWVGCS